MSILVISSCAFLVSILTFFSGFGLGTALMPVFAIWFPLELAIAMTGIVHFSNNVFKLLLVGRHANWRAILHFGLPALVFAPLGAWVLVRASDWSPLASYEMFEQTFEVLPLKLTIAILIIVFSLFEIVPKLKNWTVDQRYLPLGGMLSGFFGGLSGHQGALRAAFLIRLRLPKESFVATGVVIACLVDLARLGFYWQHFSRQTLSENLGVLSIATLSAFVGALLGNRLLKKITLHSVQIFVSIALFALALALSAGII